MQHRGRGPFFVVEMLADEPSTTTPKLVAVPFCAATRGSVSGAPYPSAQARKPACA